MIGAVERGRRHKLGARSAAVDVQLQGLAGWLHEKIVPLKNSWESRLSPHVCLPSLRVSSNISTRTASASQWVDGGVLQSVTDAVQRSSTPPPGSSLIFRAPTISTIFEGGARKFSPAELESRIYLRGICLSWKSCKSVLPFRLHLFQFTTLDGHVAIPCTDCCLDRRPSPCRCCLGLSYWWRHHGF